MDVETTIEPTGVMGLLSVGLAADLTKETER
jgi:hypothetical protein